MKFAKIFSGKRYPFVGSTNQEINKLYLYIDRQKVVNHIKPIHHFSLYTFLKLLLADLNLGKDCLEQDEETQQNCGDDV